MRFRFWHAALAGALLFGSACGGDDESTGPRPDAGIGTMMLTVAGQTAVVDSTGRLVSGEIGLVPLGQLPVLASFYDQDGSPSDVSPDRYTFGVTTADTAAIAWEEGTGFTGVLTTRSGGTYGATFRLVDTDNNGVEIFYVASLTIDLDLETVRLIIDNDTTDLAAEDDLPGVLPAIGVGAHPVRIEFVSADGDPSSVIDTELFASAVNSSDTNIVSWTAGEGFAGTLMGVAPGVASIAVRLRSTRNAFVVYQRVLTVVVQ